jgi:Protein of unknown function (DUF3551)
MRIPAWAILTIAAVSAASSARAQTYDPAYPVCLQIYQGWNDYYFECAYTSLAQCNMSASGRAAQCIVNPYYGGRKTTPPVASPRHRRVNRINSAHGARIGAVLHFSKQAPYRQA